MLGSTHNDEFFTDEEGSIRTRTNRSGGVQVRRTTQDVAPYNTGYPLLSVTLKARGCNFAFLSSWNFLSELLFKLLFANCSLDGVHKIRLRFGEFAQASQSGSRKPPKCT